MMTNNEKQDPVEGILLINKSKGKTSFSLVSKLRRLLGVKKIGHAGTLDPFATGVMIMLVGRSYTRQSDQFLLKDKEYIAQIHLGITTDTYDSEGKIQTHCELKPSLLDLQSVLANFQGELEQIPPMYSAKKIQGKKLYELARKGQEIEREPVKIHVEIQLLNYHYPDLELHVKCSKGTYIRSLANDIGKELKCGAYLKELKRIRSGSFHIEDCLDEALLQESSLELIKSKLLT
jgi:tRNA pseudouridine55 synthase